MYQYSSKNTYNTEQDSVQHYYTANQNNSIDTSDPGDHEFLEFLEAARLGELSGIKSYLQKFYYNVNATDNQGWTALMYAASYGHYNIIKSLLEHGANPNLKEHTQNRTALMMAASNGHTRCIEMLVQGKADIRLKDVNNSTAAYYATHYGHGGNKIIARLLGIPGNANNHYSNCMNSSLTNKHQSGHLDSPITTYSNDRYTMLLNHNNSLNDENDLSHYSSFNNSADNYSHTERRFSSDTQSSQLSNSLMSNTNQSIHDILKRTQPKPRALFKQRPRLSPTLQQQQHQQQLMQDVNINNGGMHNKDILANTVTKRNSFGCFNHMMQNLDQQVTTSPLRSASLSLDLNSVNSVNRQTSPNSYSPDQAFNEIQKSQANFFQYDSVFESPQSSNSDQQSFTEPANSKLESSFSYLNLSSEWNEDLTGNKRNKLRSSTFVSNGGSNNHPELPNSPIAPTDSNELTGSLEEKFVGLADDLNEFLHQNSLEELIDQFASKNIGLFNFLPMSETELKQLGITNQEHLAILIAGQLKFKKDIGIKSLESMDFIRYLGNKLENTRNLLKKTSQELESLKMAKTEL